MVESETKYPIVFNKCPQCGSERTLAGDIVKEEKAKGKMSQEASAGASINQTVIADPTKVFLSAPALITIFDVCADCGNVYCVVATKGQVQPGARMPGMGGPAAPQQFSPKFP